MTSSSQPLAALLHVSLLRPKEPLITLKKERQKCALFSIATSSKLLNLPPHIQVIFIRRIRVYDFTVTNDYGAKMHGCCRLVYNFNCVFTTLITQNTCCPPAPCLTPPSRSWPDCAACPRRCRVRRPCGRPAAAAGPRAGWGSGRRSSRACG